VQAAVGIDREADVVLTQGQRRCQLDRHCPVAVRLDERQLLLANGAAVEREPHRHGRRIGVAIVVHVDKQLVPRSGDAHWRAPPLLWARLTCR
jgi:hypothetical protein